MMLDVLRCWQWQLGYQRVEESWYSERNPLLGLGLGPHGACIQGSQLPVSPGVKQQSSLNHHMFTDSSTSTSLHHFPHINISTPTSLHQYPLNSYTPTFVHHRLCINSSHEHLSINICTIASVHQLLYTNICKSTWSLHPHLDTNNSTPTSVQQYDVHINICTLPSVYWNHKVNIGTSYLQFKVQFCHEHAAISLSVTSVCVKHQSQELVLW